jgi:hypothetical protein
VQEIHGWFVIRRQCVNRHRVKRAESALSKSDENAVARIDHDSAKNPFFSFRYSYTEISAAGCGVRVRAKQARYENGKLTTEAFEGELDRNAYARIVSESQHFFLGQAAALVRLAAAFLPHRERSDRD